MASLQNLPGILARWALNNGPRTAKLEAWRDAAIEQAASNTGGQIQNASAHGISFSLAGGLTWAEWLIVVDAALQINARNVGGTTRAVATFRGI